MRIKEYNIRGFRLRAHHLDRKIPLEEIAEAAGACGLQNSPPGAWETALFHRLEHCTLPVLHKALYQDKCLLQAWSFRGAPVVFPTALSDVFLTPLIAEEGEQPWIYTAGISGALDFLQMPFDELLIRLKEVITYLDSHSIKSKEALDRTLAELMERDLPPETRSLWHAPSMYGSPEKQTVGEAAVSFLLRPCSYSSLVVFGQREGISPTFTSFENWTGHTPEGVEDGAKELVRRFLHCYGPAGVDSFQTWLGCSTKQARRLWETAAEELEPLEVGGKQRFLLSADRKSLLESEIDEGSLLLLGAHDPYLDQKDREVLLEDKARQKEVWRYVGNPGVILKGGRIVGTWRSKTRRDQLELSLTVWEGGSASECRKLKALAEEYAAFRSLSLKSCDLETP